jgi:hypothetical protein
LVNQVVLKLTTHYLNDKNSAEVFLKKVKVVNRIFGQANLPVVAFVAYMNTCEQCEMEDILSRVFPIQICGFHWESENLAEELKECHPICVIVSPPPEREEEERKEVFGIIRKQYPGIPIVWKEPDTEKAAAFLDDNVPVITYTVVPGGGAFTGLDKFIEVLSDFTGLAPGPITFRHRPRKH